MENTTELRPVSHEFYTDDDYHGAAFVGAKAADALWFYRFDSTFIEVRDVFTCQDKVFASLSINDIRQLFGHLLASDEIHIVNVQDAYVGEFHTLVFIVREVPEDRDHVFIWNLMTLHLQLLVSAPRLLTAATITAQQAITVSHRLVKSWGQDRDRRPLSPTSPSESSLILNGSRTRSSYSNLLPASPTKESNEVDLDGMDEDEANIELPDKPVRIQGNRRQLLILGHRNGWITVYKFTVSLTGEVTCGKITSLATLTNQSTKGVPVIVAGTSEGKAFVLKYDGRDDTDALPLLMTLSDLKSSTLPITSITLESTSDPALSILAAGQGSVRGQSAQAQEYPAVSIYYLRLTKPDSRLLGHVQASCSEGETITGGRTLAATLSEDENGLRIHCAFEVNVQEGSSKSEMTIVEVNQRDVQRVDHVKLSPSETGGLLDISSQTNSYELHVLYLNGLKTYVNAADIARGQEEESWAEAGHGIDRKQKDHSPAYGAYFSDDGRFNYTEAELQEIEDRRAQLGGKLFYDRLLEFVELQTGALYPPRSHPMQMNLWTNIYFNGDLEIDNRNCLAYYLLKNVHGDACKQFLREHVIPPQFVDLMNGFWAIDHFEFKASRGGDFNNAVLYLSRPGMTVDWVEDVIEAICENASPQLARQFLISANLDLTTPKFIAIKMKTLLYSDFMEALYYQRSIGCKLASGALQDMQEDDSAVSQTELFSMLMDYCFLDTEERLFVAYCDEHSGLTSTIAQEFLILYYVNHSRYMEAIRLHQKLLLIEQEKDDAEKFHREAIERRNSRHQFGANSNNNQDGPKKAMTKSQKRQLLMNRLIAILPAAQRMVLKIEEERRQKEAGHVSGSQSSTLLSALGGAEAKTALDLDWITRNLAKNLGDDAEDMVEEPEDDEQEGGDTEGMEALDMEEDLSAASAKKPQLASEVEVMELDDSDDDL
ncbi:hypothetical protein BG004_002090 [Podila humilis]|nr:hypothetical protein BG004_002090 [Podila humilis]